MITRDDLQQTVGRAMGAGERLRQLVIRRQLRARPFRNPVACSACGFVAERETVETSPRFAKCVSPGFNLHGPGDGEPPEWITVCPECRAEDVEFDPV